MSVRYYVQKRGSSREKNLILMVCRGGRQVCFAVPIKVVPSEWLQRTQRVRPSVPGATDLNVELARIRNEVQALALRYPDDEELKPAVRDLFGRTAAEPEPTLLEHFDAFLAYKKTRVKANTIKVFGTLHTHLKSFLDTRPGGRKITASAVGPGFIDDFQSHLIGEGLANSSTNKYAARLRSFLKWLEERDAIDTAPKAKSLPTARSHVVRLTQEELAALKKVDLSDASDGHEAARDVFLMCCYTGQRISDVGRMNHKDISGDAWYLREEKTGIVSRVPLIGPALDIVEKRKGERRPLPRITEQKVNVYIKEIAKKAKIDAPVTLRAQKGGTIEEEVVPKHEVISTHVGRKTYISLMMEAGLSPKDLLGITHQDLRSLRHYAGASERHLRDKMEDVFGSANSA